MQVLVLYQLATAAATVSLGGDGTRADGERAPAAPAEA
jgi:hypothetical protein